MNNIIKTIVFEGDSHTWGEGVGGELTFPDGDTAGDKRPVPFIFPNYVNNLRRKVCEATNSCANDLDSDDLNIIYNIKSHAKSEKKRGCAAIQTGKPLSLDIQGKLFNIWFRPTKSASRGVLLIDGKVIRELELTGEENKLDYVKLRVFADCEASNITVCATEGEILIYRVECFSGSWAALNSGVGSCAAGEYLDRHFADEVEFYQPEIIALECNTINDWLRGESPETYQNHISRIIERSLKLTKNVIVHNVLPILGETALPFSKYNIDALTEVIGKTASELGVTFVDVNQKMREQTANMEPIDIAVKYYHDNWHPNEYGYKFYTEPLWDAIKPLIL